MNYAIVSYSLNRYYLLMTGPENGNSSIMAFRSKESIMKAFEGYTEAWKRDSTWHASATLGMINMQPVAIEATTPEHIREFVISDRLTHIYGGAMLKGYYGVEVSEEILKLKQFNIFDELLRMN